MALGGWILNLGSPVGVGGTEDVSYVIIGLTRGVYSVKWTFLASVLASGDVGQAFDGFILPDKTVFVTGPTGGTSAVVVEGANTPSNGYVTLHGATPGVTSLSFTNQAAEVILENPRFLRPRIETATTGVGPFTIEVIAQSLSR